MAYGGTASGPVPWWQTTAGQGGKLQNLQNSAPAGYTYDPVKMSYVHSPTQQGQAVNEFTKAASPALAGLMAGGTGVGSGTVNGSPYGGGSGGGTASTGNNTGSPAGGLMGASGRLPALTLPDQTESNAASFATAKDTVGKTGRASLDALRGELGATGNLGSGAEVQGVKDIIQSGAGELGQVSRDQAVKNTDLKTDIAKTNYAGGITQRGQDVSAQEAQARLAQEERIAAANHQLQLLTLALGGLGKAGSGLVY